MKPLACLPYLHCEVEAFLLDLYTLGNDHRLLAYARLFALGGGGTVAALQHADLSRGRKPSAVAKELRVQARRMGHG